MIENSVQRFFNFAVFQSSDRVELDSHICNNYKILFNFDSQVVGNIRLFFLGTNGLNSECVKIY